MLPGGVEHSAYCGPDGALVLDVFRRCARTTVTAGRVIRGQTGRAEMALLRKRRKVEHRADAGPFPPGWDVPARFNFTRDVVEALGAGDPLRQGVDLRRSRGDRRPADVRRVAGGRRALGSPPPHAARSRRPRAHRAREGARLARRDARRAQGRARRGPVPGHAARTRPCASASATPARVSSSPTARCEVEVEEMRNQVDGGVAVALPRRGARASSAATCRVAPTEDTTARRDARSSSTRPERRRTRRASSTPTRTRGRSAPRRRTGSTRTSRTSSGARPVPAGRSRSGTSLLGPWSHGAEVVVHERRVRPRAAPVAPPAPRRDGALPGADRVPDARRSSRRSRKTHLPRLRHAVSAGEPLNPEVIERFQDALGLTIHDGYGQTENSLLVANTPAAPIRPGSMGLPTPGHDVAVIDERGHVCPPGVEGDIALIGRPPDALRRLLGGARGDRGGVPRRLVRDGRPGDA